LPADLDSHEDASHRPHVAPALLLLGALDGAVLVASYEWQMTIAVLLTCHLAITAVGGTLIAPFWNRCVVSSVATVGLIVAGPAGLLATILLAFSLERFPQSPQELRAWYRRLCWADIGHDQPCHLANTIIENRAYDKSRAEVPDIRSILTRGEAAQKQALLGLISQRFHPDYRPSLDLLLRDSEPSVRVSAAAVFVKLRDYYHDCFKKVQASSSNAPCFNVKFLLDCAQSGFLQLDQESEAEQIALRLLLKERPTFLSADQTEETTCQLILRHKGPDTVASRLIHVRDRLSPKLENILMGALINATPKPPP
jgi:hypothetical protein